MEDKKLYRSRTSKMIFGLCGGLGQYFDVDPTLIRIFFVLLVAPGGFGIIAYIIMSLITPMEPGGKNISPKDEVKEFASKFGKHRGGFRFILGAILIAVGLSSLFGQIFPLYHIGSFFWPVLVLLFGIYLLVKDR